MKTDHLVQALAADTQLNPRTETFLPGALVLSALIFGALYLAGMGVRPDLAEALTHINVLIKQAFPVALAIGGLGMVLRLARPGAGIGRWPVLVAGAFGVVVLAFVTEMARVPSADWATAIRGNSLFTCLTSIPLISIPVVAISMWVIRQGAPTRPGLCGAVAGLMGASASASMYAFYCTDDSPMFFGIWYLVAILLVTAASGFAGARFLRW